MAGPWPGHGRAMARPWPGHGPGNGVESRSFGVESRTFGVGITHFWGGITHFWGGITHFWGGWWGRPRWFLNSTDSKEMWWLVGADGGPPSNIEASPSPSSRAPPKAGTLRNRTSKPGIDTSFCHRPLRSLLPEGGRCRFGPVRSVKAHPQEPCRGQLLGPYAGPQ